MLEAILLPVAVLVAIGVLAGVMLALFSYFMMLRVPGPGEGDVQPAGADRGGG